MVAGTSSEADDGGVDDHRHREPDAELLHQQEATHGEPGEHDDDEQRGRRDDPARPLEAEPHRQVLSPVSSQASLMRESRNTS